MAKNTRYDVEAVTVEKLLAPESVLLRVPPFQRRYSWGLEEVSQLISDLYTENSWYELKTQEAPYFLGSVVLSGSDDGLLILDGQQRLTTMSLLLAVLKKRLEEHGSNDASKIQNYLVSGELGLKESTKITLQPEDDDLFLALLSNPDAAAEAELKRLPLAKATLRIRDLVEEHADLATKRGLKKSQAYLFMARRLMYSTELVRIVAPSESEAFRLFETLNDRGLALNAADLVKNKLFAQCGSHLVEDVIDYWQETGELVGDAELVNFLRYFWIAFKGDVRSRGLYDVFRTELDKMHELEAAEFAQNIRHAAEQYSHIVHPDPKTCPWGPETGESLSRLVAFRARSCRPALLACAVLAPDNVRLLSLACESITVRYSTIGQSNPNVLESLYGKLCDVIRSASGNVQLALRKSLVEIFDIVPDDRHFMALCSEVEVNNVTTSWRHILVRLNDFVATGETRINGPDSVHVEHILPKVPQKAVFRESGLKQMDIGELVGRLGNLTLLSGRRNRSISNGPFSKKKTAFEVSEIGLNRWIADQNQWGREQIEARSHELAKLALRAWPWPIDYD